MTPDYASSHECCVSTALSVTGLYLVWRDAREGVHVYADFTFTLLSREHFSANEGFSGSGVRFSAGGAAQGRGRCVSLGELTARFTDARGEFQLELSMARVRTVVSLVLRGPALRSNVVRFAGDEWRVSGVREPPALRLERADAAGGARRCRVRFSLTVDGERSGALTQAADGGAEWRPRGRLTASPCASLELRWARPLEDVWLSAGRTTTCYDGERRAWALRCDTHSEVVRLHMQYADVHHVPRNHLRYVSWSAWLLRADAGEDEEAGAELLPGAPFAHYYAQESADEGLMMETSLRVAALGRPGPWVRPGGELRVRLEWRDSHLLFQATYHVYDDLARLHAHQLRREVVALQQENAALERQLVVYQRELARANEGPSRRLSTDTEYA